jgi:DNA-3-methyladenine glycosylase II
MAAAASPLVKAQRHLARRDPVLKQLIATIGPCTLRFESDHFGSLVRAIIAQQISGKAAASIRGRLEQTLAPHGLTSAAIRTATDDALRSAGLSAAKARSLRDLADRVHAGSVTLHQLHKLADEEVIEQLLPVRGIGPWTAQMFLIFSLGRLDVLPVADLGLRSGVQKQYGLAELPKKDKLEELAQPWQPYRSIATWYFWRSLGGVPQSSDGDSSQKRSRAKTSAKRR